MNLKQFLSEFGFTVPRDSKGTYLGVAVRRSACKIKSYLHFKHSRSSVGNMAVEQNGKDHQLGDVSILF